MSETTSARLIGKTIVAQDGRDVGEVVAVHVDVKRWTVTALGARVRRDVIDELHLKRPLIRSPTIVIATDQIRAVSDAVLLATTVADLQFSGGEPAEEEQPPKDDDAKEDG